MNEARVLRAILEVSDALGGEIEFERALGLVADVALVVARASHASVRLLAADEGLLLASARAGEGANATPKAFRRGEGLMGWVVEHGVGLVVNDVNADARYRSVVGQGFEIGAMVLEPLVVGGAVVGVLSASSASTNAFLEEHVLAFRLLARCTQFPLERARLQRLAILDQLTMAFAPATLEPKCLQSMGEARARRHSLSLLFFDLDRFKAVNDTYGHAVGDEALRRFSAEVRGSTRKGDVFIRRGGEEFVLLLPDADEGSALAMAERIRERVASVAIDVGEAAIHVTTSIGVATWDGEETWQALERRADEAVYVAKARGRNRSVLAETAPRG